MSPPSLLLVVAASVDVDASDDDDGGGDGDASDSCTGVDLTTTAAALLDVDVCEGAKAWAAPAMHRMEKMDVFMVGMMMIVAMDSKRSPRLRSD